MIDESFFRINQLYKYNLFFSMNKVNAHVENSHNIHEIMNNRVDQWWFAKIRILCDRKLALESLSCYGLLAFLFDWWLIICSTCLVLLVSSLWCPVVSCCIAIYFNYNLHYSIWHLLITLNIDIYYCIINNQSNYNESHLQHTCMTSMNMYWFLIDAALLI